jgi:hypothetical protein
MHLYARKVSCMKSRSIYFLLISLLVILLVMNAYLYRQNNNYRHQNRALILQNDSILSVNLELMNGSLKTNSSTALTDN